MAYTAKPSAPLSQYVFSFRIQFHDAHFGTLHIHVDQIVANFDAVVFKPYI